MQDKTIDNLKKGLIPVDFNWNTEPYNNIPVSKLIPAEPTIDQILKTQLVSEDLRDGLHGIPEYPSVQSMFDYVGVLDKLNIKRITVGIYPGEKNKINTSIKKLLGLMYQSYKHIIPVVLCLTTEQSLNWLGECKKINPNLESIVFMGTAPSRLLVEEWTEDLILEKLKWAVGIATRVHKVNVIGATEHTTQTPPDFLKKIIKTVVKEGAKKFCIADTIGLARPVGVYRIVKFTRTVLDEMGADNVQIEWHGHRDMGNDISNAMTAVAAGADLIHTVARGIGERAGNTQLEALLLNFNAILEDSNKQMPWNMKELSSVLKKYSEITGVNTTHHGPLSKRAHVTSLGIHTAAMLKANKLAKQAKRMGEKELAIKLEKMGRRIYTAVDPVVIGGKHEIHVGPWSGISTVKMAYLAMGYDPDMLTDETIDHVLIFAKKLGRELSEKELKKLFDHNGI